MYVVESCLLTYLCYVAVCICNIEVVSITVDFERLELTAIVTCGSFIAAVAVLSGDSKAISKAPGVGAKTAQRVILELKDKMSLEDAFEKKSEHVQTLKISGNGQVRNDAVMALTALGYSSAESLKAVSAVEITEEMDVEAVLKAALKHMSLL